MNEWVLLKIVYDVAEAEMIKGLLESGGIEVRIESAKVTPYPVNIGKIGEVKVLVRKDDLKEAKKVIKE